jgi:peptidoglycan/xylan/chitin deacetylase (PgdA/CDA1 family)
VNAKFILSLDCEGKWGVADLLAPVHHTALAEPRLRQAYDGILRALDDFAIPATFAFVGLFTLPPAELRRLEPALASLAARSPGYLGAAMTDALHGSKDGWSGDWALDAVGGARTAHELALHGVTHVPWDSVDEAFARDEMALFADCGGALSGRSTTFVYPRNAVAHADVLSEFGVAGYRGARRYPSRVHSLLAELDFTTRPDADVAPGTPAVIPPGHFVNCAIGVRSLIPAAVSRARARAILSRAVRDGGVVHWWTHPENIAQGPATLTLLRGILEDVAALRDRGEIEVVTQAGYLAGKH